MLRDGRKAPACGPESESRSRFRIGRGHQWSATRGCLFPWLNGAAGRVSSRNLLCHRSRGNDFLEDGKHSFHFLLSADADAQTAITIRTIAQGNPVFAHAVEN